MKAANDPWQPNIEAVGSLRAVKGADLSLEVSGVVDSIAFNSGDDVNEGTLLLKLRSDDDQAKLESLQAIADLNQITYDRDQKQFKLQAVSQATIDTDAANLKNAQAQAAQQQAILDKKTLKAPFTGHLGIRAVDLGQYLARRDRDRDVAGARPDLCRFLRAAAVGRSAQARSNRCREDRRVQGSDFPGGDIGDQSQSGFLDA